MNITVRNDTQWSIDWYIDIETVRLRLRMKNWDWDNETEILRDWDWENDKLKDKDCMTEICSEKLGLRDCETERF